MFACQIDGQASDDQRGGHMTQNFVSPYLFTGSGTFSLNYIFEPRSNRVSSPDIHRSGGDMGQYNLRCNTLLLT